MAVAHLILLLFQGAEAPPVVVTTTKPPGGDDAFHPGVAPKTVKPAKRERLNLSVAELESAYDSILGIAPVTKAEKKAVRAAQKAVERHSEASAPDPGQVDWVSLQADLNAVLALRQAYEKLIEDEDEDALIAILLAA